MEEGADVEAAVPIARMVKEYDGSTYLFTVTMRNQAALARFTLPAMQGGQVEVIGEDRMLAFSDGRFQDNFSGYGVHLYKISP